MVYIAILAAACTFSFRIISQRYIKSIHRLYQDHLWTHTDYRTDPRGQSWRNRRKAWTLALARFNKKFDDSHIYDSLIFDIYYYILYPASSGLHLPSHPQYTSSSHSLNHLFDINDAARPFFERRSLRTLSFIQTPTLVQIKSSATEDV